MKIHGNEFALASKLNVELNSEDNEGLIFIPKNITLLLEIENYYGKIIINSLRLETQEDEFSLTKKGLEASTASLDIKLIDRYLFKILGDKSGIGHSPYSYFISYDFTSFEKGRRLTDIDWAMFASLYVFACNVLPESVKVELSLAKELRISEENFKRFLKKMPKTIFRKNEHIESRGGNLTFEAEELILSKLSSENKVLFEESPYLKFYSGSDLA
ncbi:MAG: hypothetical protein H8D44_01030 [Actinobacteria bacterium]|jgi:hypothetical protein|nr:hypothetical protein [Actinomycetota bacterium]MBL6832853.1 hypothetical protein [Candidatus Actinomarina sp.]